jgi:hypothetical protein
MSIILCFSKYVAHYTVCFPKIQVRIFGIADFFVFPAKSRRASVILHQIMQNSGKKTGGTWSAGLRMQ